MTAPAGWYTEGNGQRYWDGTNWTDLQAPGTAVRPVSGLCIAGFVCGVSAVLFWLLLPVSVVLSILSIVFMFVGVRDAQGRAARGHGWAVFGAVLGIAALLAWAIGWIGVAVN